jgi:hypothetical protein
MTVKGKKHGPRRTLAGSASTAFRPGSAPEPPATRSFAPPSLVPAVTAIQRRADARLLVVDPLGDMHHLPRGAFAEQMRRGDLVVANDAATIPASLTGFHLRTAESSCAWRAVDRT